MLNQMVVKVIFSDEDLIATSNESKKEKTKESSKSQLASVKKVSEDGDEKAEQEKSRVEMKRMANQLFTEDERVLDNKDEDIILQKFYSQTIQKPEIALNNTCKKKYKIKQKKP